MGTKSRYYIAQRRYRLKRKKLTFVSARMQIPWKNSENSSEECDIAKVHGQATKRTATKYTIRRIITISRPICRTFRTRTRLRNHRNRARMMTTVTNVMRCTRLSWRFGGILLMCVCCRWFGRAEAICRWLAQNGNDLARKNVHLLEMRMQAGVCVCARARSAHS